MHLLSLSIDNKFM